MKEVYSKMKTVSLSNVNSFQKIDIDCKLH